MNMFTIRDVNLSDTRNFMGSKNMYSIAQARGWWRPGEPFDFTAIFSEGEYVSKSRTSARGVRLYLR